MKKIYLIIFGAICMVHAMAQERLDDIGRITMHAYVASNEGLPYESQKLLKTKLSQIITANGIADDENYVRFVLTAKVNVISKDIVAGPPQRISQKLDITFILGDLEEDKIYCQLTIPSVGVGQSLEKSYISAIKNINPRNAALTTFIQEGKEKILAYYQTHCEDLVKEAEKQSSLQNYEDALLLLSSIPDVCSDCFNKAIQVAPPIYAEMIEVRGKELLNRAGAVWAANPTREGAKDAAKLLSEINFAASCQPKAAELIREITFKMNEIDRREWEHEMQVYRDGIEREKREYEESMKSQRLYIKAVRDVAVAYAKNQPKVVTKVVNYNRISLW